MANKKVETVSAIFMKKTYGAYWVHIIGGYVEDIPKSRSLKVNKPLPTKEEFKRMQDETFNLKLSHAFDDAKEEVEFLSEDMESWCDNMSGTSLENTDKYSQVDEAASSLENIQSTLESAEDFFSKDGSVGAILKITVLPMLGKASRSARAGWAASVLEDVSAALLEYSEKVKDDAERSDIEETTGYLEDAASELQNVEFPGMY